MVKAIVAGVDALMLGGLLAGLEDAPVELVLYEGRQFKQYRGMGSMGAMQSGYGRDRYASGQNSGADSGNVKLVPEGIEGMVPIAGSRTITSISSLVAFVPAWITRVRRRCKTFKPKRACAVLQTQA